jgi:hypothetical protein
VICPDVFSIQKFWQEQCWVTSECKNLLPTHQTLVVKLSNPKWWMIGSLDLNQVQANLGLLSNLSKSFFVKLLSNSMLKNTCFKRSEILMRNLG